MLLFGPGEAGPHRLRHRGRPRGRWERNRGTPATARRPPLGGVGRSGAPLGGGGRDGARVRRGRRRRVARPGIGRARRPPAAAAGRGLFAAAGGLGLSRSSPWIRVIRLTSSAPSARCAMGVPRTRRRPGVLPPLEPRAGGRPVGRLRARPGSPVRGAHAGADAVRPAPRDEEPARVPVRHRACLVERGLADLQPRGGLAHRQPLGDQRPRAPELLPGDHGPAPARASPRLRRL